jgi:hypothetical protein
MNEKSQPGGTMEKRPTRIQVGKDGNTEILTIEPATSGWTTTGWLACGSGVTSLVIGLANETAMLESIGLGLVGFAGFALIMGALSKVVQYLHWQTNAEFSNIKDFYN